MFHITVYNSKASKNSEYYLFNPGFAEKLRPLRKTFFSSSVNSYEEKLKITLSELWVSLKVLFDVIVKGFCYFCFCILSWCKIDLSLPTRSKEQM